MGSLIDDVLRIPLRRITVPGGDVLHAMKASDPGYNGFGEAYFSCIGTGVIKAWKRHLRMTMNLVVPVGLVRFVFWDDESGCFRVEVIGAESDGAHYARLSVPPGLWFGFQGCGGVPSIVLNLASIEHEPLEVERLDQDAVNYDWT
jgi:dTDP-4-dehydrorhamnose 3,5-epimerase